MTQQTASDRGYQIAFGRDARKCGKLLYELTRFVDTRENLSPLIQVTLIEDRLRCVALNRFAIAVLDIGIRAEALPCEDISTAPMVFIPKDIRALARSLKKGGLHDALSIRQTDERLEFISRHDNTTVVGLPEYPGQFYDWAREIPEIPEDWKSEPMALNSEQIALAANLCAVVNGAMVFSNATKTGAARIDCSISYPQDFHSETEVRIVVAAPQVYIRWDDAVAIDFATTA